MEIGGSTSKLETKGNILAEGNIQAEGSLTTNGNLKHQRITDRSRHIGLSNTNNHFYRIWLRENLV